MKINTYNYFEENKQLMICDYVNVMLANASDYVRDRGLSMGLRTHAFPH